MLAASSTSSAVVMLMRLTNRKAHYVVKALKYEGLADLDAVAPICKPQPPYPC